MRILHVIETLGRGGAEQLLVTLLPELVARGHQVAVAVQRGPFDLAPALKAGGVQVLPLPLQHRWRIPAGARALTQAMPDAEVIHAHLYFPAVCTAYAGWRQMTPARCFVSFHNLAYAGANAAGIGLTLRRWLAAYLYPRGLSGCLAVSQATAAHYQCALGLRDIGVLPNPVDIAAITPISSAAPTGVGPLRLVLPGRVVPEKGHFDALEALAHLARQGVRPMLDVLGDGPLRTAVTARAGVLGLMDQIRFAGALNHPQMLARMAAADVVIVPSRFEGFGITALEAMALGRPVIASTAGGLPETLGETAVYVPPADPAALARAIKALAVDPARRAALGQAGRHRARHRFDVPRIAGRLLDVYEAA